ncbi:MAG: efflux RND transporter permease subunit [Succinivibrionaceae bacterium]|nr:efflux RND transporter permease subunit [Succinivibrionaceae bacterium]
MLSKFFIHRPIFAWVIAIVLMLLGVLSVATLPVAQYPQIAPPQVSISATYPGASSSTVENTVTKVIEQNLTGLDGYLYMSSTSDSYGQASINVTFEKGTDPDIAQVQVQNKLQQALTSLPQIVQQQGISVRKSTSSFLMVIGLISDDPKVNANDLSDYMTTYFKEPISRLEGVGEVQVFGAEYSMRIWIDPGKLSKYAVSTTELLSAIKEQNAQIAYGSLGGAPSVEGQTYSYTIVGQTRLTYPEQFQKIVLKVTEDGKVVRLEDVARVELGAENYNAYGRMNGQATSGLAIRLATGANALQTAELVNEKVKELEKFYPQGIHSVVPFDTTPFIEVSIHSVYETLFEAIILVFIVMYVFLQNIRATIIPTIAVPVVLLGTFAIMSALGFSINTLTMFGLVLAIGLLVDDAIVVVENVERLITTENLPPRLATIKSMDQITGALIGIAMVLSAVFVPMAFFGGSTGVIYRQFSITIVSAMLLSVVVALVLTPALCASILKEKSEKEKRSGILGLLSKPLDVFFKWFNAAFNKVSETYQNNVRGIVHAIPRFCVYYAVIIAGMVFCFMNIPKSFLPEEDQGVFFVMTQLPAGATVQRTDSVVNQIEAYFLGAEKDNIESLMSVVGFSFAGSGQNVAMSFVKLKPWAERPTYDQTVYPIVARAFPILLGTIDRANAFTFNIPAVPELGTAQGIDFYLVDHRAQGHSALIDARNMFLGIAGQSSILMQPRPNGLDDVAQLKIHIDYEKALSQGISISELNQTLSAAWGSSYVDDFIYNDRVKKVYVQADAPFRMNEDNLNLWYVKNNSGKMVPFKSFASTSWIYDSPRLERFNAMPAVNLSAMAAPGHSTGEAMDEVYKILQQLPPGYDISWNGVSFQERQAGDQAMFLYAVSLMIVFLSLAALYESWSIPFAVMLIVPLGVFGAVGAAYLSRYINMIYPALHTLSNDVYFQVGLLTTIGLSAKNAILIVEFAKDLYDQGKRLTDSVVEAARIRLRPILMTSLAFCLGVLPLAVSTGAGANSQNEIGVCVLGGMITATVLAIFFVPVFFVLVMRYFTKYKPKVEKMAEYAAQEAAIKARDEQIAKEEAANESK